MSNQTPVAPHDISEPWWGLRRSVTPCLGARLVQEGNRLVASKQREVARLTNEVQLSGTDEFIANEARTKYRYLLDGEIRFVITNPEVLWGEEGLPTQAPVKP